MKMYVCLFMYVSMFTIFFLCMLQTKFVEKIITHFMYKHFFSQMAPFMRQCGEIR